MSHSSFHRLLFPPRRERDASIRWDDWNERFQRALELKERDIEERIQKFSELTSINRDFIAVATSCAKTIITELFVRDSEKSVRSKPLPGFAGGQKFVLRGILFKLAIGESGPYFGSDEAAAKAAGHDLLAANHYFSNCPPGLHIAPQAIIDYKGFRMLAQALLPIDRSTLKIGTMDGTVKSTKCDDPNLLGTSGEPSSFVASRSMSS